MSEERSKIMDKLIAQDADLIEFMASDAACYLYPDEGQQAERAAYTRGCAEQAAELAKFKALAETLAGALDKSRDGWANALEFGLIPERHRNTAEILAQEAAEALRQWEEATQ